MPDASGAAQDGNGAVAAGPSVGHRAQGALLNLGARLARSLGPVAASNLGGWLARTIGPWLPVSRVADRNITRALPELDPAARRRVLVGAWDNLGRTAAELPHVAALRRTASGPGWECDGEAALRRLLECRGPVIFFSAHLANWEIIPSVAAALGLNVAWFYRPASNPLAEAAIRRLRGQVGGSAVPTFPKGRAGAYRALAHLRQGGLLGMLVDQKLKEGIAVPFFGMMADTAPLLAQFGLKLHCPIIPVHVVRLGPARFRVICEPPVPLPDTGDHAQDVYALTLQMNRTLERWIREQPECWLWLHRRWPKDAT